jgi:hypothetical protein
MVAKAATKAGEFYCFHCGKQVRQDDASCNSCGSVLDKITEAFRCPRCSNLLPIGAAACPACGLGFKVRTISGSPKISEDDKFLMKLIDWGQQGEASPPKAQVSRAVKAPPAPPPPSITRKVTSELGRPSQSLRAQIKPAQPVREAQKPVQREPPKAGVSTIPQEAKKEAPKVPPREPLTIALPEAPAEPQRAVSGEIPREAPKIARQEAPKEEKKPATPTLTEAPPKDILTRLNEAEANLHYVTIRNMKLVDIMRKQAEAGAAVGPADSKSLHDQLQAGLEDIDNLEAQLHELREAAEATPVPPQPVQVAISTEDAQGAHGLSNQALKKLLDEREREVTELKEREEELARKEEHLNRKIRAYAVKKKELDTLSRQLEEGKKEIAGGGEGEEIDFPNELVVDDRQQWIKEQSKIKNGLIEIRNELAPKKEGIGYAQPQLSSDIAEKIEILEEKLVGVSKERDDLSVRIRKMEESEEDVVTLLRVLDQLLGKLPPEIIDEFSKSKDFKLYEKVLDDLNI